MWKSSKKEKKNEVEYFHQCVRKYLLRVSRVLKSKANLWSEKMQSQANLIFSGGQLLYFDLQKIEKIFSCFSNTILSIIVVSKKLSLHFLYRQKFCLTLYYKEKEEVYWLPLLTIFFTYPLFECYRRHCMNDSHHDTSHLLQQDPF